LKPRQIVMTVLIGVVFMVLSLQVSAAYCPTCQVHYNNNVMTVNTPASAPQGAPTQSGPLSILDPSTAFTSPSQVNLANIVLQLL